LSAYSDFELRVKRRQLIFQVLPLQLLFVTGKDRKLSEARGMAGWLIMELGGCPLEELGKRTGRDVTTLSSGVKRLQIRSKSDLKLADAMKLLLKAVS
jgi:chromosomal replication initiation ATPase DnaA